MLQALRVLKLKGRRYDIGFVGRVYNIERCQFRVGEDVGCFKALIGFTLSHITNSGYLEGAE